MRIWRLRRLNHSLAILLVFAVLQLMFPPVFEQAAYASESAYLTPSPGEFYFDSDTIEVYENAGSLEIRVSREDDAGLITGPATVDYSLTAGSAAAPGDYTNISGTLYFESWRMERYISVPIIDDLDDEGDEQFTVQLSNPTGGADIRGAGIANIVIMDNDDTARGGTIQFGKANYTVKEGVYDVEVILRRTDGSDGEVEVDLDTVDGTATSSVEYEGTHMTVTFPEGSVTQKVRIPVYYTDGDKQFSVQLGNPTGGASLGAQSSTDVTVEEDGLETGSMEFPYTTTMIEERDPYGEDVSSYDVSFRVYLDGGNFTDSRYPFVDVIAESVDAVEGVDYEILSSRIEFNALFRAEVDLRIYDNDKYGGNKTITLKLRNPTYGYQLGENSSLQITLLENEEAPSPGMYHLDSDTRYVDESAGVVTVAVYRWGNPDWQDEVTIDYTTTAARSGLDATAGADYTPVNGTLTFGKGETMKTITVPILDDNAEEVTEFFNVELRNAMGGALINLGGYYASIAIRDNDSASVIPKLSFHDEEIEIPENYRNVDDWRYRLTIMRTGSLSERVTVDYATVDGTALAGQDYEAKSGTITFQPGEATKQIDIPLIDDSLLEAEEEFSIVLSNPSNGAELGAITSFNVKIQDNEDVEKGIFQFDQSSYTVDETSGTTLFKIIRTGGSSGEVALRVNSIEGTALNNDKDYYFASRTLTFKDGQTEAMVAVDIYEDALVEGDETFTLDLLRDYAACA